MVQGPQELVSDFAHRFCYVQTELTKLIPGIHMTPKGEDLELQYAFAINLRKNYNPRLLAENLLITLFKRSFRSQNDTKKFTPPKVWGGNLTL